MLVEAFIAKALICISGVCHPAIFGADTPIGRFPLVPMEADSTYKGEVLVFAYAGDYHRMSVHRPPSVKRRAILEAGGASQVSAGCINVTDEVYEELRDCCSMGEIEINE